MLNPSNGNVLAMYSNPSFDPNPLASQNPTTESNYWNRTYITADSHGFLNGVSLAYDYNFVPGSTFKVITTAAAYDHSPSLTTKPFPTSLHTSHRVPTATYITTPLVLCGGTVQIMLPQSCDTGYASMGIQLRPQSHERGSIVRFLRPASDRPSDCTGICFDHVRRSTELRHFRRQAGT